MELFPAIDLKNGQCVRLAQGDFNAVTIYDSHPLKMARKFFDAGARWLHLVDLDGAREGQSRQLDIIEEIAEKIPLKLQTGGGIRESSTIDQLLAAGAERIVIGSLAITNQSKVQEWLRHYGPERIVLAFDVKMDSNNEPEVLTHGWQSGSQQSLWMCLDAYADSGLQTVLCTDVQRDGMLSGANFELYKMMQKRFPALEILASGGVSNLEDLLTLAQQGLAGTITGKALYEGRINLAEAVQAIDALKRHNNAR